MKIETAMIGIINDRLKNENDPIVNFTSKESELMHGMSMYFNGLFECMGNEIIELKKEIEDLKSAIKGPDIEPVSIDGSDY